MALTDITKKIIDDAKQEAEKIEQATRESVEEIEAETVSQKESLKQEHDAKLKREIEHRLRQAESLAEQKMKLALETIRRKHIDSVFAEVKDHLSDLPSSEYKETIKSFLADIDGKITGTLLTPQKRLEETKEAVRESDHDLSVKPDETIEGGFRITGSSADYDYTFDRMVDDIRDRYELDVARELFGGSSENTKHN